LPWRISYINFAFSSGRARLRLRYRREIGDMVKRNRHSVWLEDVEEIMVAHISMEEEEKMFAV